MKIVLEEIDRLTEKHKEVSPEKFNNDTKYKLLTTEAIDAKTMALRKIDFFMEKVEGGAMNRDRDLLMRIVDTPFAEFAHRSTKLELETGDGGFPWRQAAHGSATVEFKAWRPQVRGVDGGDDEHDERSGKENHMKIMIETLAQNQSVRVISVGVGNENVQLQVPNGWAATTNLSWESSAAVQDAPGIVNMLLQCCVALVQLNLRQGPVRHVAPLWAYPVITVSFLSSNGLDDAKGRVISPAFSALKNLQDLDLRSVALHFAKGLAGASA